MQKCMAGATIRPQSGRTLPGLANAGQMEIRPMYHYNAHVSAYRNWLRKLNLAWGYRTR